MCNGNIGSCEWPVDSLTCPNKYTHRKLSYYLAYGNKPQNYLIFRFFLQRDPSLAALPVSRGWTGWSWSCRFFRRFKTVSRRFRRTVESIQIGPHFYQISRFWLSGQTLFQRGPSAETRVPKWIFTRVPKIQTPWQGPLVNNLALSFLTFWFSRFVAWTQSVQNFTLLSFNLADTKSTPC